MIQNIFKMLFFQSDASKSITQSNVSSNFYDVWLLFVASITTGALLDVIFYRTPDLIESFGPIVFVAVHSIGAILIFPVISFIIAGSSFILLRLIHRRIRYIDTLNIFLHIVLFPIIAGTLYDIFLSFPGVYSELAYLWKYIFYTILIWSSTSGVYCFSKLYRSKY